MNTIASVTTFAKTERGTSELQTTHGSLTAAARRLLIMIDGQRSIEEISAALGSDAIDQWLPYLEREGYVRPSSATTTLPVPPTLGPASVAPAPPSIARPVAAAPAAPSEAPRSGGRGVFAGVAIACLGLAGAAGYGAWSYLRPASDAQPASAASAPAALPVVPATAPAAPPPAVAEMPPAAAVLSGRPVTVVRDGDASRAAAPAVRPAARVETPPVANADEALVRPRQPPVSAPIPATSVAEAGPATPVVTAQAPAASAHAALAEAPATSAAPPAAAAATPKAPDLALAAPSPAPQPAAVELHLRDHVLPVLPRRARRMGVDSGLLRVRLHVTPVGTVASIDVLKAEPSQVYDVEVQRTLQAWTFDPPGQAAAKDFEFQFRP